MYVLLLSHFWHIHFLAYTGFYQPFVGLVRSHQSLHYNDVIMSLMASEITSLTSVCSTVYSGADQRKHQSSVSLASVQGIRRGPVNSSHKGPVARKMFPFDDVFMAKVSSSHSHMRGPGISHWYPHRYSCSIFMNEKCCILIKSSLKFVPKGVIDNNPVLVLDDGLAPNRRRAIIWN